MIRFDRDAEVARARLNTLMGRQPETPIEVQGDYAVNAPLPTLEALVTSAIMRAPISRKPWRLKTKSRKEEALAKKAMVPDFNVSAGYMLMPAGTTRATTTWSKAP